MLQSTTEVREAITAAIEKFMAAYNQGDAAGLATLYTENGQLLPTSSDFITGKPAIQKFWQARMDPGVRSVKLESVEIEAHDATAIEVGLYSVQGQEDQVLDRGKYIAIWKLEKGQWKLHRDMMNSSLPPQG
ncbi:MAG: SgcJ/EcaC family oxidoreductase [Pseudomonadota bacterium]